MDISRVLRLIFHLLAMLPFAQSAIAAPSSPSERRLVEAGIEPTEAGMRKYIESLLDREAGKPVEKLIAELADPEFKTREEATRRLLDLDPPPIEKLQAAAKSEDAEQAIRASGILAALRTSRDTPLLWALRVVAEKKLAVGVPLLIKLHGQSSSASIKEAAVRAMLASANKSDRATAEELLKHDDLALRSAGRRMIASLDGVALAPIPEGAFAAVKLKPGSVSGGGPNLICGWEFEPKSNLLVTHLGIYDHGVNGLNHAHEVAIWDLEDARLPRLIEVVPAGEEAPLSGVFRLVPTKATKLEAGRRYAVVAHYTDPSDSTVSLINPSGLELEFGSHFEVIARRYSFPHRGMAFPDHASERGVKHATLGPTFRYEVVPE
jgi:hypothetical protein